MKNFIQLQRETFNHLAKIDTNNLGISNCTTLAVYTALKYHYYIDKEVFPSYDKLAELIHSSRKTVIRAINVLVQYGFVIKATRENTRSNYYYFPTEEIDGYWELFDDKKDFKTKEHERFLEIKNNINQFAQLLYSHDHADAYAQYEQNFLHKRLLALTCTTKKPF